MSSISNVGGGVDNWETLRKLDANAAIKTAEGKIKDSLAGINDAIGKAGNPDTDPNDPDNSN